MQHVTNAAVMHATTVHTVSSSFWPSTLGAWGAIIAAVLGAIASVLAGSNRNKLVTVHNLVNGNLKTLLDDMDFLRKTGVLPARRATDTRTESPIRSDKPSPQNDPPTTSTPIIK